MRNKETICDNTILIVDDDLHILEVLDARLASSGFSVMKASGAVEAIKIIKANKITLMISDMKMPDMSGMNLLTEARTIQPDLPVIFLTAYGTIPEAVTAVKAGAIEYLTKPFDGKDLIKKINGIIKKCIPSIIKKFNTPQNFYLGNSSIIKELYDIIQRIAASDVNVLILGESGVGKERISHLIHELSVRKEKPFVVVDCGSTPTTLLESELFGHVKGSFTNAVRDKKGLIEVADTGTLFLDEIGNISHEMQVRLLRFLEDRKIRRVGDVKEILVDCRIISATNANLIDEIKAGNFREDLYYRLRVVALKIPPLRERKEDIPILAQNFVENFCKSRGIQTVKIPQKTIDWLCNYPWPGNIRELKNALDAGVVLCRNGVLHPDDLNLSGLPTIDSKIITQEKKNPSELNHLTLEESERNTIIRALQQVGGIQKEAAKSLGISRRSIHYKVKKYGINSYEIKHSG